MKLIVVLSLLLLELGFSDDFSFLVKENSLLSNDINYSKKDVPNKSYNQKSDRCSEIGQIAAGMAMLKWASRKVDYDEHKTSSKEDELNRLTMLFSDKYEALGLSNEEVKEMATTIRDYTVVNRMEIDALSFAAYYRTHCKLKKEKRLPKQVKEIYLDMNDCWVRESQTGIRAESCIDALVEGGEGSVDANFKLLVEGKNRLKENKAKLAIKNYFNPIIENCNKKNTQVYNLTCADATYHKGSAYIELKELSKAKQWIKKAIKLLPKDSLYVSELAFVYQLEKNLVKALEIYKRAEDIAKKDLDYLDNRFGLSRAIRGEGFILIDLGRLSEAKEYFKKALELNPDDKSALNELKYIESLE